MIKRKFVSHLYSQANLKPKPQHKIASLYSGICAEILRVIRRFRDPVVAVPIGKRILLMNASHQFPIFKFYCPYHDTAIVRLCKFLKEKQNHLTMIDVGANVGYTVSLIAEEVEGDFLCVEAEKGFHELLLMNTKNLSGVICEKALVSDVCGPAGVSLIKSGGTAHLAKTPSLDAKESPMTITIDKLTERHQRFSSANVIKIDTDGYDYKVIRGCRRLIKDAKPAIFFELAPQFLNQVGKEDLLSIFDDLSGFGYTATLWYDNLGFPLGTIDTRQRGAMAKLLNYARIKNNFYYDVLTVHDSSGSLLEEFYQSEIKIFPEYKYKNINLNKV